MTYSNELEAVFTAWSETYNGFARWSAEDKADWLNTALDEGFGFAEAESIYENEKVKAEASQVEL